MLWNKNTIVEIFGSAATPEGLENVQNLMNKFLKEKGDLVKDILVTATTTVGEMPYISWTVIYEG